MCCLWQFLAIIMALLRWLQRKDHEGVPKTYVTPDPPPYWIFRTFKVQAAEDGEGDGDEAKASAA